MQYLIQYLMFCGGVLIIIIRVVLGMFPEAVVLSCVGRDPVPFLRGRGLV